MKTIEYFKDYLSGNLSDSEKTELFDSLESDAEAKSELCSLQNTWAIAELLSRDGDAAMATHSLDNFHKQVRRRSKRRLLLRISQYAAIICFLIIGTWFLSQNYFKNAQEIRYTEIFVPKGQRVNMKLTDGTVVWLSPQTKIKIPNEFNDSQRIVELDGEGFFNVAKESKRPFIVKTKKYDIKVLGTKFNVFAYSKGPRFETDLIEGSVLVSDKSSRLEGVQLNPNEKAIRLNDKLVKIKSDYTNEGLFEDGIFSFYSKPFVEILDYLSLWNNVKFKISGDILLKAKITGKFKQSDNIKEILIVLQRTNNFKFRFLNEHEIEIYK